MVKVAMIQTHADDDAPSNLERTLELIDQAAGQGAELVCLQELFLGPYFCQVEDQAEFDRAESIPGPTTDALSAKAKEHGIVIVGSIFERRAKGVYHNTAVVLDADGSLATTYRKMHIPDDPRYYEKFYFTPGDQGFRAVDTAVGRIAPLVCWDQWFPESGRSVALQGADIVLVPTAIGIWQGEREWHDPQHDAWRTVQRGQAIANGVFWVAVNRVGKEDELEFWGGSFAADPLGRILHECGDQEEVAIVEIDLREVESARRGWPFLRDRRVDAYGGLLKRFDD